MKIFYSILQQDLYLAFKGRGGVLNIVAFFVITSTLFSFGTGPDSKTLMTIGNGVIWVCALLSSMLAIPNIFDEDFEDGSLAQLILQGALPEIIIAAKLLAHWLSSSIPLIILSPFLAQLFFIPDPMLLALSLCIGTTSLTLISAAGAALTLGLKNNATLAGIIVLPLYIPILIFGSNNHLVFLIGILLFILPISIMACSASIKISLDN